MANGPGRGSNACMHDLVGMGQRCVELFLVVFFLCDGLNVHIHLLFALEQEIR